MEIKLPLWVCTWSGHGASSVYFAVEPFEIVPPSCPRCSDRKDVSPVPVSVKRPPQMKVAFTLPEED